MTAPTFPLTLPTGETFVDERHLINTLGAQGALALMSGQLNLTPDPTLTPAANQYAAEMDQAYSAEDAEKRKKALQAIYGDDFPLVMDDPQDSDWKAWAENRWDTHRAGVQNNLYMAERNRLMRAGAQWLSRNGSLGQWREPPMPKDAVRIVDNKIRPALAWALQIVSEQRPGWRFEPINRDPERERKAEAQQMGVEYQWRDQNMLSVLMEAGYWAQTDGVAFLMTYWNTNRGPWEELEAGKGPVPMGDPDTKVYRIEQVRVSAEATATVKPMYWLVREILPKAQAVALYGPDAANSEDTALLSQQSNQYTTTNQYAYTPLYQDQETVARYQVFCEKSEYLPGGLTVIICGEKVVFGPQKLVMGAVPMARVTDGSEDPAFYPMPRMNELVAPQMRINMLRSKWYESIRVNAGGRFLSKSGALVTETLIGGQLSAIEIRGAGPLSDTIQPVQGFSIGEDVKEALLNEIKNVEDLTGWNDTARGQFTSEQSGRAILAIREQLERTFAPFVGALSMAMVEWAKQQVGWMKWGYAMPRMISMIGSGRSDLARSLTATDFDGIVDVSVDPETLMPMPRALRLWLLEDALTKGAIDMREYRRRLPFAFSQDMSTPDDVQEAKAKRICEAIRQGQPPEPMVWQDNEAIQQDVLEHDLILQSSTTPPQMQAAMQRWQELAGQSKSKMTPPPPDPNSPEGNWQKVINTVTGQVTNAMEVLVAKIVEGIDLPQAQPASNAPVPGAVASPVPPSPQRHGNPGGAPRGAPQNPRTQPLFRNNPPVAAAPSGLREHAASGGSDQQNAAKVFEKASPQ